MNDQNESDTPLSPLGSPSFGMNNLRKETMSHETPPGPLDDAGLKLLDLVEELGAAAGLLREARYDYKNSNVPGAQLAVGDVIDALGTTERLASELAAELSKWVNGNEQP